MVVLWIVIGLAVITVLAFHRASLPVWSIALLVLLLLITGLGQASKITLVVLFILYFLIFVVLNIRALRRLLISNHLLKWYRKIMPTLSDTEQAALESGTVGWEGDLFSGMPDWDKLRSLPFDELSTDEQAFLNGPVEEVCQLIDHWQMSREMEIPSTMWDIFKKEGFFGMIIPKCYGGKEFSALGHAQVILKLASASIGVATVVSVPNSLGPAELLLCYGTAKQKDYYLPRLASGKEIPCFALTSPVAGSDAGSITDFGIVCRAVFEGEEQLCLRLNWDKRYITLSPVATLLGLAFKCYDPEHLLGEEENLGITCALVPTHLPGVVVGRRHFPLHSPFPNGPTQGDNVLIPLEWIIGGKEMIGQGWRMLMECLAAGRGISIPSMVSANAKLVVLASGAYTRIRRQFNVAIAQFEGVQEVLARMAGHAYAVEALRLLTLSYVDLGGKPAVGSAIGKYHTTEFSRRIINDAMDIQGGKGICMGPSNYLAQCFIETPIGVTVEGANILTRAMIIYGQGAIRCHPYLLAEMKAAVDKDRLLGAISFDRALFSHLGFMGSNKVRSFILAMSQGRGSCVPDSPLKRYYQLFSRFSAAFAFISDVASVLIGADLKRREMLSARLGDVLSFLYMGSAVLKHFQQNQLKQEIPLVRWTCQDLLFRIQTQLDALISNFPHRFFRFWLRILIFPRGKNLKPPSDALTREVAHLIIKPSRVREHFSEALYYTAHHNNPVAMMEDILAQVIAIEPIEKKLVQAYRKGTISGKNLSQWVESAIAAHVITPEEGAQLLAVDQERMSIINVDDFASDEM